jgi:anti-sigma regulatory factor (Ser/Thr protein kinase)
MWTAQQQYPCSVTSARDARRFCLEQLSDHLGSTSDAQEVADTAELIVSELVTNAVNADCSLTGVRLSCRGESLRIAVLDDGPGVPAVASPTDRDEHGRGLAIIDAVAAAWGVESEPDHGKQVWAELTIPPSLVC